MNLACFVIDDESYAADLIRRHIERTPELVLAGVETDPVLAVKKITSEQVACDVAFLDINMPMLSGLEVAEQVMPFTHVVFVTGDERYAVAAFEQGALDYLLKPATYPRFLQSIARVREKMQYREFSGRVNAPGKIILKSDRKGKFVFVDPQEILYIESLAKYLKVHLVNKKIHLTYQTLYEMEERLPASTFLRIHRSYIVNLNLIEGLEGNTVELNQGARLPLSASYKDEFLNRIKIQL